MSAVSLSVPRVVISGTGPGVGKSLLTLGLAYELRRRRQSVSCVVLGPRLAQATILKRVAGRSVRCFDPRILNSSQILASLFQAGVGADFLIVEGQYGLFDGQEVGTFAGSDAELAALTKTPVVVVVDARSLGSSVAALVKGFSVLAAGARTEGGFDIAGVVLNRLNLANVNEASAKGARATRGGELAPERDIAYYKAALESFGMPAPLGVLPEFVHESKFPGDVITQQNNETLLPRQFLVELHRLVQQHVDVDRLIEQAELAPAVPIPEFNNEPMHRRCRIAVSDDSCFHLVFQDNLEWLRYYGVELVTFSPLADEGLPKKIGAVYLTGACLPEYAQELSRNKSMMNAIAEFSERGGVVYAEGAGCAYVCKDFLLPDTKQALPGVGLIPMSAVANEPEFAYEEAVTLEETVLGRPGLVVRGVGTNEWVGRREERIVRVLKVSRGKAQARVEGYSPGPQIFATFSLLHFGSNPQLAKNLADAAEVVCPTGTGS